MDALPAILFIKLWVFLYIQFVLQKTMFNLSYNFVLGVLALSKDNLEIILEKKCFIE